jgi:hypothetical protein
MNGSNLHRIKGVDMKKALVALLAAVAMPLGWRAVEACGDKFLLVGRGLRFQRAYASVHPGNILIYTRTTASATAAIRDTQFQKNLRQAGHAVSVIEDKSLLERALETGAFDIVLADVADAPNIDALISSAPSRPKALYVMYPSGSDKKSTESSPYVCKLKSTDRATRYLDLIESEMQARVPRRPSKS